jgi:RNA polymerase sigma-70 factor (ECF subfamily)
VEKLHGTLLRVAGHELGRRRGGLGMISGPEFDDLVHQAAHDALLNILAKVDEFRGESRFITWAYKFVVFEVSAKASRHAWQRQPPRADDDAWARLSDSLASQPAAQAEQQEQLAVLVDAVASDLTPRQREVFVAVALNDVPIDALALRLQSNRNAIYKNLFDARRKLRASLEAAGHPLPSPEAVR